MDRQGFTVPALLEKPILTEEESQIWDQYWASVRVAHLEGSEFVTPSILVTYFNLYPPYDIAERGKLVRLFLDMTLAHRRVSSEVKASVEQEQEKLDKNLRKNKEEYEKLKIARRAR